MTDPDTVMVFLNGVLMKHGSDYHVSKKGPSDDVEVQWTLPGNYQIGPLDEIRISYQEPEPEPSAVDQLADLTKPPEERSPNRSRETVTLELGG